VLWIRCNKNLPLSEFSYSQRKRSRDGRKCMKCLQPYYTSLNLPFSTYFCCICKRYLPVSFFQSKFAAKDQKNVCLTCPAMLFPKVAKAFIAHVTQISFDFAGEWICPEHPEQHPSEAFQRYLSWELEVRYVSTSSSDIQRRILLFIA
jgi:hypothetical protein